MTAMSVVEHLKLDDKVPVSAYAASAPPSKIKIKAGETYTVRDLLYALLLSSANDAARALAERVSGCEEEFARQLTREVRQWGAYRTTLATANGLPADNQFTTAQDLALMFKRAMGNPELVRIMATKYYTYPGGPGIAQSQPLPVHHPPGGGRQNRLYACLQAYLCGDVSEWRPGHHRCHDGEQKELGRFAAPHRKRL